MVELLETINGAPDFSLQTQRSRSDPDLLDKSKAIASRTEKAHVFPTRRTLAVRRPDRVLPFSIHNDFVLVTILYSRRSAVIPFGIRLTVTILIVYQRVEKQYDESAESNRSWPDDIIPCSVKRRPALFHAQAYGPNEVVKKVQ